MNLYDYHKDPKSLHKYKEFMKQEHTWKLDHLPGQGRGGFDDNLAVDPASGLRILSFEGYSNDEDDEDDPWDDFGDQYYDAEVVGSQAQVQKFIDEHFYGEGNITLVK